MCHKVGRVLLSLGYKMFLPRCQGKPSCRGWSHQSEVCKLYDSFSGSSNGGSAYVGDRSCDSK